MELSSAAHNDPGPPVEQAAHFFRPQPSLLRDTARRQFYSTQSCLSQTLTSRLGETMLDSWDMDAEEEKLKLEVVTRVINERHRREAGKAEEAKWNRSNAQDVRARKAEMKRSSQFWRSSADLTQLRLMKSFKDGEASPNQHGKGSPFVEVDLDRKSESSIYMSRKAGQTFTSFFTLSGKINEATLSSFRGSSCPGGLKRDEFSYTCLLPPLHREGERKKKLTNSYKKALAIKMASAACSKDEDLQKSVMKEYEEQAAIRGAEGPEGIKMEIKSSLVWEGVEILPAPDFYVLLSDRCVIPSLRSIEPALRFPKAHFMDGPECVPSAAAERIADGTISVDNSLMLIRLACQVTRFDGLNVSGPSMSLGPNPSDYIITRSEFGRVLMDVVGLNKLLNVKGSKNFMKIFAYFDYFKRGGMRAEIQAKEQHPKRVRNIGLEIQMMDPFYYVGQDFSSMPGVNAYVVHILLAFACRLFERSSIQEKDYLTLKRLFLDRKRKLQEVAKDLNQAIHFKWISKNKESLKHPSRDTFRELDEEPLLKFRLPPQGVSTAELIRFKQQMDEPGRMPTSSDREKLSWSLLARWQEAKNKFCEPDCMAFVWRFFCLFRKIFIIYQDTKNPDDRCSGSRPLTGLAGIIKKVKDTETEQHLSFPGLLRLCTDFQLFPEVIGYHDLRFLYEASICCDFQSPKNKLRKIISGVVNLEKSQNEGKLPNDPQSPIGSALVPPLTPLSPLSPAEGQPRKLSGKSVTIQFSEKAAPNLEQGVGREDAPELGLKRAFTKPDILHRDEIDEQIPVDMEERQREAERRQLLRLAEERAYIMENAIPENEEAPQKKPGKIKRAASILKRELGEKIEFSNPYREGEAEESLQLPEECEDGAIGPPLMGESGRRKQMEMLRQGSLDSLTGLKRKPLKYKVEKTLPALELKDAEVEMPEQPAMSEEKKETSGAGLVDSPRDEEEANLDDEDKSSEGEKEGLEQTVVSPLPPEWFSGSESGSDDDGSDWDPGAEENFERGALSFEVRNRPGKFWEIPEEKRLSTEHYAFLIFNEMCSWMETRQVRVIDIFKRFDADRSGGISPSEFREGCKDIGMETVSQRSARELWEVLLLFEEYWQMDAERLGITLPEIRPGCFVGEVSIGDLDRVLSLFMNFRVAAKKGRPNAKLTFLRIGNNNKIQPPPKIEVEDPAKLKKAKSNNSLGEGGDEEGEVEEKPGVKVFTRIFASASLMEVLLLGTFLFLERRGNPTQKRLSSFSQGMWLLAKMRQGFLQQIEGLSESNPIKRLRKKHGDDIFNGVPSAPSSVKLLPGSLAPLPGVNRERPLPPSMRKGKPLPCANCGIPPLHGWGNPHCHLCGSCKGEKQPVRSEEGWREMLRRLASSEREAVEQGYALANLRKWAEEGAGLD